MMCKKSCLAVLLAWIVCLSGGCGLALDMKGPEMVTEKTEAAKQEAEVSEEASVSEQADLVSAPQVDISTAQSADWYSEDGSAWLLHGEYTEVSVSGDGYETVAESVRQWMEERKAQFLAQAEEYASWAAEDAVYDDPDYSADYYRYYAYHTVMVGRADDRVISFVEMDTSYTGGAHGNYGYGGTTFDARTGEILALDDMLKDVDGFRERAAETIVEKLREKYGDGLYEDYADAVSTMWNADSPEYSDVEISDPEWYLDAAGITFVFNPYEVGPFAMGEARVTLPYEDFQEYIKEDYMDLSGAGAFQLPMDEMVAVSASDADGTLRVYQAEPEEYMDGMVCLEWKGTVLEIGNFVCIGDAYVLRREDGRTFLLVDADYASDDYVTFVCELADSGCLIRDRLEGATLSGGSVNTQGLTLYMHLDVLGSYRGEMTYALDDDGALIQQETFFRIPESSLPFSLLTTAAELPVAVDGADSVLPIGSHIRITATDNAGIALFQNDDTGEEGEIHFVRGDGADDNWTIYIDGVPDYDYFEVVPYAG